MGRKTRQIPRLVGARVDRLRIACFGPVDVARIRSQEGVTIAGERYRIDARKARRRALGLAGRGVEVSASERIAIVDVRAPYLATHTPAEAVAMAARLARGLCSRCERMERAEVWALDLCADLAGATFTDRDSQAWVTRLRGIGDWHAGRDRDGAVTGLTLGNPRALAVVVYDKLRQVRARSMVDVEHARWKTNGWDGKAPIWRVEFRLRGSILTEYGLRDPSVLAAQIDGVWQALVTKSVRLVDRNSATRRERCKMDPRWEPLNGATFVRPAASPAEHARRTMSGSTFASSLGSMMSTLRASGVSRAEAETLLAPIVARLGTPADAAMLRTRIDRAWERVGCTRSVGPGPRKAGARGARKRSA